MTPVKSSQISHIGHDPETNTLHVRFHGGTDYHYANVSAEQHNALLGAKSIGAHFHAAIKGNPKHPHTLQTKKK